MGKKEKEKVTYIDDGRTIADMSGVGSGVRLSRSSAGRQRSSAREVWNTYWNAVKMMFVPMLVVIGVLIVLYLLLSFIFLLM